MRGTTGCGNGAVGVIFPLSKRTVRLLRRIAWFCHIRGRCQFDRHRPIAIVPRSQLKHTHRRKISIANGRTAVAIECPNPKDSFCKVFVVVWIEFHVYLEWRDTK